MVEQLREKIDEAAQQLERLHRDSIVLEGETIGSAIVRINAAFGELRNEMEATQASIEQLKVERQQHLDHQQKRERHRVELDKRHAVLMDENMRALEAKAKLEADDAFLRLLQSSSVNGNRPGSTIRALAALKPRPQMKKPTPNFGRSRSSTTNCSTRTMSM